MKVIEINMKVAKLIRQTKKSMDQTYTLFRRRQEEIWKWLEQQQSY